MFKVLRWAFRIVSMVLLVAGLYYWMRGPEIPQGSYLVLDVSGSYSEGRPGGLISRLFARSRSLFDVTEALRKVRHDGRIAGVVVRIDDLSAGWAQTQEIRSALAQVKSRGKRVIAALEVEMSPASKEVYLASVADAVYVAPAAAPMLVGLQTHSVFLGGVWPKIDVSMQVEKIREYKSAGDELSRESMTPAHREMLESILDDIHGHFVRTLSEARNLAGDEIEKAIARGISRPAQLVEAGIANAVRGPVEVLVDLGGGKRVKTVSEDTYAGVTPSSLGIGDGPSIAVIHASGAVMPGKGTPGGGTIGARTISQALADAADEASISAIVLRVSSPGGSPAASDEIWLAVREAAKKKPVIASMGDVAASGGYYMVSGADRIVASPGTLTGSIGVVFYKPDIGALLHRVGVNTETIQRGRFAGLFDVDKSLDAEELEIVRTQISDIYRLFLERVATGRKKRPEEIDRVGGGRVWTGQQAFERGLVDEIGSFDDAVRAAANAAGIHDIDKVQLVHYPRAEGLAEQIAQASATASATMQPLAITRIVEALGNAAVLLPLEPGIHAVADGIPVIE